MIDNRQLSEDEQARLAEVELPKALLGELAMQEVPEFLRDLASVARVINGMSIYYDGGEVDYYDEDADLRTARTVVERAEEGLRVARREIENEIIRVRLSEWC